ncbi:MAG: hypothetical protein Q4Q17_02090 [Tissierellia bacterium]|nr:hypothetical protein [Tissierellia bacterium]
MDKLILLIMILGWVFSAVEKSNKKKKSREKEEGALVKTDATDVFSQSEAFAKKKRSSGSSWLNQLEAQLSEWSDSIASDTEKLVKEAPKPSQMTKERPVLRRKDTLIKDSRSSEGLSMERSSLLGNRKRVSELKDVVKIGEVRSKKSLLTEEELQLSHLRKAIVLKEILDKPVALR